MSRQQQGKEQRKAEKIRQKAQAQEMAEERIRQQNAEYEVSLKKQVDAQPNEGRVIAVFMFFAILIIALFWLALGLNL